MFHAGVTTIDQAIGSIWGVWFISWIIASGWSARTAKTTRPGERALELLLTVAGVAMLMSGHTSANVFALQMPVYSLHPVLAWLMVVLVAGGFAFSWWARVHLGTMWSANITLKEGHRIIDTGPYALVRHPIYTGILFSAWATAVAHGNEHSFLGAALMTLGFYLKSRREEQLLIVELGAPYEAYRRRVPMLVPHISAGS